MIPIHGLFEAHLNVRNLDRSMKFFGEALGLRLASTFPARRVAFFWAGKPGESMIGLWETGDAPQRTVGHIAFTVSLPDVLKAPALLRAIGVTPLDFWDAPTDEPVVLGWMPAASIYFRDPDGNLIELLAMLEDEARPDAGIVRWSQWLGTKSSS